jgi:hypothetical protein
LIPGGLIFFLPFIYPTVNEWIAGIDFGVRLNPLIASSIYFLLPGVFLGTISPYVIRLAATQLSTVGSTAGTLYAVSTCGSIFGTLLTAFYLIPLMGVSNIIHFLGIILVCLSLVVVPLVKTRVIELARAVTTLAVVIGSITMAWTPALWARTKTLLEKDTFYHRIRIEEDDEARYMYFDRTLQSAMNLKDPTALRLIYSYTCWGSPSDLMKKISLSARGAIPKLQKEFRPWRWMLSRLILVIQMAKSFQRPRRKTSSSPCRTEAFFNVLRTVRYYSDRRLLFGRYAVSPRHTGVF